MADNELFNYDINPPAIYQQYAPPTTSTTSITNLGATTIITTINGGGGGQATGPTITIGSNWSGVNFVASGNSLNLDILNAANARGALDAAKSGINTDITQLNGASQVDVSGHYAVNGVQVVQQRDTGWSNPTGATSKATFDPATVTLTELGQFVAALYLALQAHGLIGN